MKIGNTKPLPRGRYSGMISGIKITDHDSVEVVVHFFMNRRIVKIRKEFIKIFTRGRDAFQLFCESFELFKQVEDEYGGYEYELALEEALGYYCIISFAEDGEITIVSGLSGHYSKDELDTIFEKVSFAETVENVPLEIQKYFPFPCISNIDPYGTEYLGFITHIEDFENTEEPDDLTLRVTVRVFNGGKVSIRYYYLNRIFTNGEHETEEFFNYFGTDYYSYEADWLKTLKKIIKTPLSVSLYKAQKSGRTYVKSLEPYNFRNEHEKKQIKDFFDSYRHFIANEQPWEEFCC